ncbi:hypothetical protein KSP39_PZI009243 [Platanthera zijinensis]|uniref:Uncharacterized protein n=1 Tax=Platanthera zijinensis TaxID=2320716 RepID=A0AAP0BLB6_9ASPA
MAAARRSDGGEGREPGQACFACCRSFFPRWLNEIPNGMVMIKFSTRSLNEDSKLPTHSECRFFLHTRYQFRTKEQQGACKYATHGDESSALFKLSRAAQTTSASNCIRYDTDWLTNTN